MTPIVRAVLAFVVSLVRSVPARPRWRPQRWLAMACPDPGPVLPPDRRAGVAFPGVGGFPHDFERAAAERAANLVLFAAIHDANPIAPCGVCGYIRIIL